MKGHEIQTFFGISDDCNCRYRCLRYQYYLIIGGFFTTYVTLPFTLFSLAQLGSNILIQLTVWLINHILGVHTKREKILKIWRKRSYLMKISVIYFFIIVFANTIGSISGMGGGIIIKPMMDAIGMHSLVEIAFYSSTAVLSMSIFSTWRQFKNPININIKLALFLSSVPW